MQKSAIPKQQQYRLVLVDTWWFWVSMEWYWLIYDDTGSVEGASGWYWVSMWQCWLIYDGTGSVEGGTGWYLAVLGQWKAALVDI